MGRVPGAGFFKGSQTTTVFEQLLLVLFWSKIENLSLPNRPKIHELFPNPFNPSLNISFSIPSESVVNVLVYNMIGEQVATLMANQYARPGYHSLK